jgi:hypothetical protein
MSMPKFRSVMAAKLQQTKDAAQQDMSASKLRDQLRPSSVPPASSTTRGGVMLSDDDPLDNGVADPGTSSAASRADHVHEDSGGGGGSLTVTDGTTTVTDVTNLAFPSGTISTAGAGLAEYTPIGGGTDLMTLIYDQIASGTDDPIDFKITSGAYVVLGFFKGNNTSGWSSPTNALHTVTTGKRFIVVRTMGSDVLVADTSSRAARLRNTTDSTDVVTSDRFQAPYGPGTIPYSGDGATATTLNSAASGKAIELQLWNTDTTKRAMGAIVIGREV